MKTINVHIHKCSRRKRSWRPFLLAGHGNEEEGGFVGGLLKVVSLFYPPPVQSLPRKLLLWGCWHCLVSGQGETLLQGTFKQEENYIRITLTIEQIFVVVIAKIKYF